MQSLAIIKTGGKQYKVEKGTKLSVEKLLQKEGSEVVFNDVLLLSDAKSTTIGNPTVKSAKVTGKVLEQIKDKKVIVFKYKRRKRYSKKMGHRQLKTIVEITGINKTDVTTLKKPAENSKIQKSAKKDS